MTRQRITHALWGLLIIILGIAALAYNFGALDDYKLITAYVTAALLALMGVTFLLAILFQKDQWFYVIPGFSFLSLGGIVYLATLDTVAPAWLGALLLGGIALGFLVVYLHNRQERWWALLQAETILIMIGLIALGIVPQDAVKTVGVVLFGGFALSFFFVWLFSGQRSRFAWALILAGALAVFAAVILTSGQSPFLLMLWPALLILIGIFLIARVFSTGSSKPAPVPTRPSRVPTPTEARQASDSAEPARIHHPNPDQQPLPMDIQVIEPEDIDEP